MNKLLMLFHSGVAMAAASRIHRHGGAGLRSALVIGLLLLVPACGGGKPGDARLQGGPAGSVASAQALQDRHVNVHVDDCNVPGIPAYAVDLAYLQQGPAQAPVLLLLHDSSASKEFFKPLLAEPALQGYRVIAVDLPGHGRSGRYPEPLRAFYGAEDMPDRIFRYSHHTYTFPGYAHLMVKFMAALQLKPEATALMGTGLGGEVAIAMVAEQPRLRGALLKDTPIVTWPELTQGVAALRQEPGDPAFPGLNRAQVMGLRQPFSPAQARAYHAMMGNETGTVAEEAGVRADPDARHVMAAFAEGAAAHTAMLGPDQAPLEVVRHHPDRFAVVQGAGDPDRVRGPMRQRLEGLRVGIREVDGPGRGALAQAPGKVAALLVRRFPLPEAPSQSPAGAPRQAVPPGGATRPGQGERPGTRERPGQVARPRRRLGAPRRSGPAQPSARPGPAQQPGPARRSGRRHPHGQRHGRAPRPPSGPS